ncbi:MAG: LacI family DNA-binding transcriptional regulator [Verrucomicrobiota bacterium]|jgi:DNA-binding LacI/PurR family transcriptional regulator
MSAGLKEVAAAAGVSVQTVSDILNCGRQDRYDPKTQSLVRKIALQQHYRPQRSGRVLRSQSTGIVGFIAANYSPDDDYLEHYDVYPFLVGASHYLTRHNHHVGLVETAETEPADDEELPHCLREKFFDGFIAHWGLAERFQEILRVLEIPVIWWDVGLFAPHNCLDRDEMAITQVLTQSLIELGHRRIGLMVGQRSWQQHQLTGKPPHYSYGLRYEGYRAQMLRHNQPEVLLMGYEVAALAAQMQQHQLTAVITQSAASVPIVQLAAQMLGQRVPQDLSIAALDVETRMRPRDKKIGGMAYDRYTIGQQAAGMLLDTLRSRDKMAPSLKFTGEFSIGDTIGSPHST